MCVVKQYFLILNVQLVACEVGRCQYCCCVDFRSGLTFSLAILVHCKSDVSGGNIDSMWSVRSFSKRFERETDRHTETGTETKTETKMIRIIN